MIEAATVRHQQDNPRSPNMLLRTVSICHARREVRRQVVLKPIVMPMRLPQTRNGHNGGMLHRI